MIPMVLDHTLYARYSVYKLPAAAPIFDAGPVDEMFKRIDITGRGQRQKAFKKAAEGKIVLRLGFELLALDKDSVRQLFAQLANDHYPTMV